MPSADTDRMCRVMQTGARACSASHVLIESSPVGTFDASNGSIASSDAESTIRRCVSVCGCSSSGLSSAGHAGNGREDLRHFAPRSIEKLASARPVILVRDAIPQLLQPQLEVAMLVGQRTLPAAALPQTPRYCVKGETSWL